MRPNNHNFEVDTVIQKMSLTATTFLIVVPPRIELGTHGFSVRCSTN